jgi:hypothetical protein
LIQKHANQNTVHLMFSGPSECTGCGFDFFPKHYNTFVTFSYNIITHLYMSYHNILSSRCNARASTYYIYACRPCFGGRRPRSHQASAELVHGEGLLVHGQRDAREEGEEALHHHQAPRAVEHRGARPLRRRAAHVSRGRVRGTDTYS